MDIARLERSPVGSIQPIVVDDPRDGIRYEHAAFIPKPIPRKLRLAGTTTEALLRAQLALGRLDGAASELMDPLLLVRPTIRREAVSTSALEGTYTALDEVLEAEASGGPENHDVREVLNYVEAAERGIALLGERPIGLNLVNELHGILMRGTRGDSYERGRVRTRQNWIGPRDRPIVESQFVPPPPGQHLLEGIGDWEAFIHDEEVPLLVRAAIGHYQFETLHPYHDGNGRLGRLLVVLQLIEAGTLHDHLLSPSPYLERRRDDYVGHLQRIRETGSFEPWLEFFCAALEHESRESLEQIARLRTWRDEQLAHVRSAGTRGLTIQITGDLVGYPYLTIPAVAERYGYTYQAASNAVRKLVELDILREAARSTQPKVFVAADVVRLLRR